MLGKLTPYIEENKIALFPNTTYKAGDPMGLIPKFEMEIIKHKNDNIGEFRDWGEFVKL